MSETSTHRARTARAPRAHRARTARGIAHRARAAHARLALCTRGSHCALAARTDSDFGALPRTTDRRRCSSVCRASSLVSFFLNVANFLVTKATSPVTLQVLGNIKVVLLIMLSVAIFGNEVSLQAACGCAVCIAGVVLYNHGLRSAPTKPRTDIQPGTPPSPALPRC